MQFRDLHAQYEALKSEIDKGINDVINSTSFILGRQVTELENELASYVGRKHCVSCGNGTDALVLALKAHNVGAGDAVFTADFTYIASASCAELVGATSVFADIDLNTFNICPKSLEEQIQKVIKEGKLKPKAIVPVDLFRLPANFEEIEKIAKKYNLIIVEDAAQGFGGNINGKMACSFGDISCTSFFPAKPLGCYGDGGAIFTDDDSIAERLRSLRAGGKSPVDKYDNREIGTNSRLDTIQAAILLPKFHAFKDYEVNDVNKVAGWYTELLKDKVVTPKVPSGYLSSWAQYTILLKNSEERSKVQSKLKENGIPSMIYYPRGMHQQQAFKNLNLKDSDYPNAIEATKRVLSLPMHPYMKKEDVELICSVILKEI
ncbi:MAG: DegT/DnrJ/EryC1/StrS family aminotransferase [Acholeplasmatales bacterium]|nr:DegT/DnrJ/EryC1/StrS family aminotransferase [Acholeplasmatales bacterium]